MEGELERNSLWYKYKTRVWLEDTLQTAVVHNIIRAVRSFRNFSQLAYISTPMTSGKYFYELFGRSPFTREECVNKSLEINNVLAWVMLDKVSMRRKCPIIFPPDLTPVHQEWEQDHFQALWLSIIAEKCTEVHMRDGWEFSNGGVEEFVHVMQLKLGIPAHPKLLFYNSKEDEALARKRMRNIAVFDSKGMKISPISGHKKILSALKWFNENNIKAPRIENGSSLMKWTLVKIKNNFYQ